MDSQQRPIVVVTGSRQEHMLFTMGYSIVFGVATLVSGGQGHPVFSRMDRAWFAVWALAMILSGVTTLAGCFWRQNVATGLLLEQVGLYVNSACLFVFALLAVQVAGTRAAFTLGICTAWILANVARAWRVRKDQRQLRGGQGVSSAAE